MNPEFEKEIIADLEKSGFSSELRSIRTFLSCGWGCTGFANYFDLDQELITGVDLYAWKDKEVHQEKLRYGVQFRIDAEVKKAEKNPWIVFKEQTDHVIDDHINNLTHICGLVPFSLRHAMAQNSAYSQLRWKAYGIHEGFKKPSAPSRSYSAMINACKSAEYTLKVSSAFYREFEERSKGREDDEHGYKVRFVVFVKPIVVLDGILLAASLSDTGQISIEEIQFAPVLFHYKSKHCEKGIYLVDIVTLEGLEEYIRMSESRHQTIFDEVEYLALRAS
jgi:hypothetical protein